MWEWVRRAAIWFILFLRGRHCSHLRPPWKTLSVQGSWERDCCDWRNWVQRRRRGALSGRRACLWRGNRRGSSMLPCRLSGGGCDRISGFGRWCRKSKWWTSFVWLGLSGTGGSFARLDRPSFAFGQGRDLAWSICFLRLRIMRSDSRALLREMRGPRRTRNSVCKSWMLSRTSRSPKRALPSCWTHLRTHTHTHATRILLIKDTHYLLFALAYRCTLWLVRFLGESRNQPTSNWFSQGSLKRKAHWCSTCLVRIEKTLCCRCLRKPKWLSPARNTPTNRGFATLQS